MKLKAILILVSIVLSVFLQFTVQVPLSPAAQGKCYVAIDVCNASGSYMPVNADAPSLPEGFCRLLPAGIAEFMETDSSFALTSFPGLIEQPPRILS